MPQAFRPRIRTKYVPRPTFVATRVVAALPVSLSTTRFVLPENDPASSTYDRGDPADAFQVSVTVDPLTLNASPVGALGGPLHGPDPTINTTSLDGALVPKLLVA